MKWKLNRFSLRTTFISLVSSLYEYTALLIPTIAKNLTKKLQVTQNNALRVILNRTKFDLTTIDALHAKAKLIQVEPRCLFLAKKYSIRQIEAKKPLILKLINDSSASNVKSPIGSLNTFINNYKRLTYG